MMLKQEIKNLSSKVMFHSDNAYQKLTLHW